MIRYIAVKADAQSKQILAQNPGFKKLDEVSGWWLLRVNNPRLVRIARQNPTRAEVLPALGRSVKHLSQRVLNFLQVRGIVVEADDTILDLLVKLTGDEDFE